MATRTRPMQWGAGNPSTEWGTDFAILTDDGPGPLNFQRQDAWPDTIRMQRFLERIPGMPAGTQLSPDWLASLPAGSEKPFLDAKNGHRIH